MPPLTVDADGWFTAVGDAQAEPSISSPVEKPGNNASTLSSRSRASSEAAPKENTATGGDSSSGWITATSDKGVKSTTPSVAEKSADVDSSSSSSSSDMDTKESSTTSNSSIDWIIGNADSQKSSTTPSTIKQPTDTVSIASTPSTSTSASSPSEAGASSSTKETSKRLRPRARSATLPPPSLGLDPKLLVGKVLTHIRRSPDHPTVTLSFADGTTYQILVDGYDPRNSTAQSSDSSSSSRTCVLEMDEVLLRMLEVPGRHVVDRAITDCAHIRLADKAYERREWEQSWQQSHVAVAFKFAEERRWHCVWAMRAEYDERGCIFRAFDDVYLQALERPPPRSPQKLKSDPSRQNFSSPQKAGPKDQFSPRKSAPKPPPSPTAKKAAKSFPNTPKKNKLGRTANWKNDT